MNETLTDKDFKEVLSRAFFKLWEMIVAFKLIPETDNFRSAHIAEGPGGFIQATMYYRDHFTKQSTNDKIQI